MIAGLTFDFVKNKLFNEGREYRFAQIPQGRYLKLRLKKFGDRANPEKNYEGLGEKEEEKGLTKTAIRCGVFACSLSSVRNQKKIEKFLIQKFSGGASSGDWPGAIHPIRIKGNRFVIHFKTDREDTALNATADWGFRFIVCKRG